LQLVGWIDVRCAYCAARDRSRSAGARSAAGAVSCRIRHAGPTGRTASTVHHRHLPNHGTPTTTKTMADTLTITDNRTGKQYELPITDGTIRATDLKKIKTGADDDQGIATYDPAFMNTAACRSRITYIDGDKGILLYRGYPIEQLAERS